ncbi:hypothetical protein Efla_005340 [Eimeria flavescens]
MGHSCSSSDGGHSRRKSNKERRVKKDKKVSQKSSVLRAEENESDEFAQVDKEEVDRLLLSLLQLSPELEVELLEVFKQLDSWGTVYLQDLGDLRLRKKLRHLFRALIVGEVEGERGKGWRKLPTFKRSLAKFVKRRCKDLRAQVDGSSQSQQLEPSAPATAAGGLQGETPSFAFDAEEVERKANEAVLRWRAENEALYQEAAPEGNSSVDAPGITGPAPPAGAQVREEWMLEAPSYLRCLAPKDDLKSKRRRTEVLRQKKKEDEEAIKVKVLMEEWNRARKVKSLREMRSEAGDFAEGEEAYKRWKGSMDAARNAWGKRAAEQATELEMKDDVKKGQPWQRFDRERDLQDRPQVPQADYEKLVSLNGSSFLKGTTWGWHAPSWDVFAPYHFWNGTESTT